MIIFIWHVLNTVVREVRIVVVIIPGHVFNTIQK